MILQPALWDQEARRPGCVLLQAIRTARLVG